MGPLEATGEDGRPIPIDRQSQRELMLVLLLLSSQPAPPARLIDALWGDKAINDPLQALRKRVHELRGALGGPDRLQTHPAGYQLRVLPGELDAEIFRALARNGQQALQDRDHAGAARLLQQASDIWREPAWENPPLPPSMCPAATELDELRQDCQDALVDARLALGQHTAVIAQLRDTVRADPLREHPLAQLMLAYCRSGQTAAALNTYSEARKTFATELGLDPGPELEQLHRRILGGDDQLMHSGDAAGPSLAAAAAPAWTGMCQLPAAPADFTGRSADVDLLQRRLGTGAMTITVISGPPGAGKTALALYTAHQAYDLFPDGQLFARLGSPGRPRDPQDILEEMLHALGISTERMPPVGARREALYRAILAHRRILLIADDAATAAQVRPLLPGTDGSAVLVTSRARLPGLEAAQLVNLGEMPADEAVALLGKISGQDSTDGEALTVIASHCGHLPLALRIAGSRLAFEPGLSACALAQALSDPPRRLAELTIGDLSVAARFEPAYRALSEQDRWAFRLASVHPGDIPGWLLGSSAGNIAAAGLFTEIPAPGQLGAWYRLHRLTRLYAGARLAAEDPPEAVAELRRRVITSWLEIASHANHRMPLHAYLPPPAALAPPAVAPPAECAAAAEDAAAWFARNRATLMALTKLACSVDPSLAAALADCQFGSQCQRREYEDGHQLWERIAAAASAVGDTLAAARARHRMAALMVAQVQARHRQAARILAGCLPAFSLVGDKQALANTHYLLALCGLWDDDPAVAFRNAEQGLAEARQGRDRRFACLNLSVLGAVLAGIGRTMEGLGMCDEALALATDLGDTECAEAAGHMLNRARLMVDSPPELGGWSDRSWAEGQSPS